MTIRPGIELANLTDVGCERPENEDYYCYAEPESEPDFQRKGRLAIVADGMGGHAGGQVASGIAVETVRDTYLNYPGDDPREALSAAFDAAQSAILEHAREHPDLEGMGSTCTAAVVRDGQLYFGQVGDSRLYLLRGFSIQQITNDHSVVAQMVRDGLITPEQAATHPDRNVLTAALGMESALSGDFPEAVPLQPNDTLLICSDGLHGLVGNEEMLAVTTGSPPREACQELVRIAKDRGGFDNITVQILRIL
jgi:serine/threonine protein phosphatase PrpC